MNVGGKIQVERYSVSVVFSFVLLALIGVLIIHHGKHPTHSTNSTRASSRSFGRPSPCAAINLSLDSLLHDAIFHRNRLLDVCTPPGQVRVACKTSGTNCVGFPPGFPKLPDCANNSHPGICRDGGVEWSGVSGFSWDSAMSPPAPIELPVILCSTLYETLLFLSDSEKCRRVVVLCRGL